MSVIDVLIGILGLALLMVVHEAGHFFSARAFGMRVITFSIGFGPTFFKVEPHDGYFWFTSLGGKLRLRLGKHVPEKHGPTVYQVAMIPFLAYVQIAGMNPFEEHDPDDTGSYANASLKGRIVTIFGGPLSNYLFASVLFFFSFYYGGVIVHPPADQRGTVVEIIPDRPAAEAGIQDGDTIVEVAGTKVSKWKEMSEIISKNPAKPLTIVVLRRPKGETKGDGERITIQVTPQDKDGKGLIGVMLKGERRPVDAAEAAKLAVTKPTVVVENLVVGLGQWITGQVEAELGGPVKIVEVSAQAMRRSPWEYLALLGALSAYLGAFNLIPFPALDGGRLMFLGYELATRRKPNAKIEAHIHVVGLMMLLGLMLYVTIFNDFNLGGSK
jgi:regulator of sigma E protease